MTLIVLAAAVAGVVACNADATTSSMADTVRTVDTVRIVDTVGAVDTVHSIDTVHTVDTVAHVSYYIAAFHEDSSVPYCAQPICQVVPSTANFTGSITERTDSMFVAFGNTVFDPIPMTAVHLDSLPMHFQGPFCGTFDLYVTGTSNTLRGRWVEENSCNGSSDLKGTLVGTLQ